MPAIFPQDIVNKHYPYDDECVGHQVLRAYLISLFRYAHLLTIGVPFSILRAERRMLSERKEKLDKYLELRT